MFFFLYLFQLLLKYLALLKCLLQRFGGKLFIVAKEGISTYFEIGLLSVG